MKTPDFNSDNFYKILGLEKSCDSTEIKKQYRKLAKDFHPDKNKGDKEKSIIFVKVNKAYETLSSKEKRSQYDDSLIDLNFNHDELSGWTNYFDELFNQRPKKGEDVHVYCRLTLEELKVGCEKIIPISEERLRIKIKPNTSPGTELVISGKGSRGLEGQPPGDLFIKVVSKPHDLFKVLDSGDLSIIKVITYQELMIGVDIILNTLTGKVKITIPERSDISKEYRLKGLGIGGDIILSLKLYVPTKKLSKKERAMILDLNSSNNLSNS